MHDTCSARNQKLLSDHAGPDYEVLGPWAGNILGTPVLMRALTCCQGLLTPYPDGILDSIQYSINVQGCGLLQSKSQKDKSHHDTAVLQLKKTVPWQCYMYTETSN